MDEHQYACQVGKPKKKSKDRHNCCVPGCTEVKSKETHLHYFPSKEKDPKRRKEWIVAIRTGKEVSSTMQVCSKHFKPEDYIKSTGAGLRLCLKPTAVPSSNLPIRPLDKVVPSPVKHKRAARADRARKRSMWTASSGSDCVEATSDESINTSDRDEGDDGDEGDDERVWVDQIDMNDFNKKDQKTFRDAGVQVEPDSSAFIESILSNDKKLFTATGLHSVQLLNSLTTICDELARDSIQQKLKMCTRDRIILTMMKIKLSLSFSALAILLDVAEQTCANYFYDSVEILAKALKCMIFWPEKEDVLKNMPKCFSKFKATRVILDCYETPIGRPKCIACRVRLYSHYKKNFTAKVSMNITPSGLICHCSATFGGRASDKVITENTGIYQKCDPGDAIMVDKGYNIEEECHNYMLSLIRPPFLRNNRKFTRAEAVRCAKIARARVHVERVIQRVRNYHILKNKIPWQFAPFLDDIVVIVSSLVNLGKPVLACDKY